MYFYCFVHRVQLKIYSQNRLPPKWEKGQPSLHHSSRLRRLDTRAFGAPHSRLDLPCMQMQFLDPPMYLAKIGLLHRSPPSLCGSLFMLTTTSELSSRRATTTLGPCDTCVNIHLTTETAQTLPAALSCQRSTTATHCCMALLLQTSRSCRQLKTTSLWSSVSSVIESLNCNSPGCAVQQRTQYKIAVITQYTHKALWTSIPPYTSTNSYNAK